MTRVIILLVVALAGIAGIYAAARHAYSVAYETGFHEAQRLAAIEAEQSRISVQTQINSLEKQALDKIASQTASNVEKAIADARKANPACSLVIPGIVLDQLRHR